MLSSIWLDVHWIHEVFITYRYVMRRDYSPDLLSIGCTPTTSNAIRFIYVIIITRFQLFMLTITSKIGLYHIPNVVWNLSTSMLLSIYSTPLVSSFDSLWTLFNYIKSSLLIGLISCSSNSLSYSVTRYRVKPSSNLGDNRGY